MTWRMPAESAPLERVWMAFPCGGSSLGDDLESAYSTWTAVAHATADFGTVTMVVDPSESRRAQRMLGAHIERVEAPLDDCWMRDIGPTFVLDDERPDVLGAVDWTFNGWGAQHWARWERDREIGRFVADAAGAEPISSLLVNEGGAVHTDGAGTLFATETVQLDPDRNRYADKQSVEAEFRRTLGAEKVVWLPRGLTRDYEDLGTRGHVDMVAAMPSQGRVLLHVQPDAGHPDHEVIPEIRAVLEAETNAADNRFEIIELPAPGTSRDDDGFVDWSYVNHLVVNDGVVSCGYGDREADAHAAGVLAEEYPGRTVVTVDARPILERGGGIHCITQNQPAVGAAVTDP